MPALRLVIALAAVAALVGAAGPAAAGCRLSHNGSCAHVGAACPVEGRRGTCQNEGHHDRCLCATPISHGGGPSHRR